MSNHAPVIIVKKKKGGHGGHHGGAWKVAYADFVTAMMAFFLVMWLVNQPQDVKDAVAGYFKDPGIFEYEGGRSPIASGAGLVGNGNGSGSGDVQSATASLERAAERIKEQIKSIPGFKNLEDQVEVKVTAEGLRIELQEGGQDTFFDSGSAHVKGETQQVLKVIAKELASLPQSIAVEGHTDAAPMGRDRAYTNWELSADRANAARRIMEAAGLPPTHVKAVRGFAATILRTPDEPFNPRNRRVSIVVQNAAVGSTIAKTVNEATGPGHAASAEQPPAAAPPAQAANDHGAAAAKPATPTPAPAVPHVDVHAKVPSHGDGHARTAPAAH
ncbi:MAG TPA: flagellar motor protein MotB [Luteitalea sp.]|nr:flagellar motor protein MotB [Luteitalea sp.]